MKIDPLTLEERKIMNLLVDAHNLFIKIEATHPNDINEWVEGIHKCQHVLQKRILRRDYPDTFPIKE